MAYFLQNEKKSYSKHLCFARKKESCRTCYKMTDGLRISACYTRGVYFSWPSPIVLSCMYVESSWNMMAYGDAREGKWRGNWRMWWEHGVSNITATWWEPRNMVYQILLPLMRTPRLPVFDWTEAPADLNGLVRFAERRNLASAPVPSHFRRSLRF